MNKKNRSMINMENKNLLNNLINNINTTKMTLTQKFKIFLKGYF